MDRAPPQNGERADFFLSLGGAGSFHNGQFQTWTKGGGEGRGEGAAKTGFHGEQNVVHPLETLNLFMLGCAENDHFRTPHLTRYHV